jgi:hypothetical protein
MEDRGQVMPRARQTSSGPVATAEPVSPQARVLVIDDGMSAEERETLERAMLRVGFGAEEWASWSLTSAPDDALEAIRAKVSEMNVRCVLVLGWRASASVLEQSFVMAHGRFHEVASLPEARVIATFHPRDVRRRASYESSWYEALACVAGEMGLGGERA